MSNTLTFRSGSVVVLSCSLVISDECFGFGQHEVGLETYFDDVASHLCLLHVHELFECYVPRVGWSLFVLLSATG